MVLGNGSPRSSLNNDPAESRPIPCERGMGIPVAPTGGIVGICRGLALRRADSWGSVLGVLLPYLFLFLLSFGIVVPLAEVATKLERCLRGGV